MRRSYSPWWSWTPSAGRRKAKTCSKLLHVFFVQEIRNSFALSNSRECLCVFNRLYFVTVRLCGVLVCLPTIHDRHGRKILRNFNNRCLAINWHNERLTSRIRTVVTIDVFNNWQQSSSCYKFPCIVHIGESVNFSIYLYFAVGKIAGNCSHLRLRDTICAKRFI